MGVISKEFIAVRDQVFKIIPRLYQNVDLKEINDSDYGEGFLFGLIGRWLVQLFAQGQVTDAEISQLLCFFEECLNQNNEDPKIDYAITVYFIEAYTDEIMKEIKKYPDLNYHALTDPLGPKCLEYAQAIDKFWGTKTPGIKYGK